MKKKPLLLFAAVLLFAIVFVACDKGGNDPRPQPSGAILPSVITYTRGASAIPNVCTVINKFEYDVQDRISKIHSEIFDNGVSRGFVTTFTFTYNGGDITTVMTRTDIPGEEISADRFLQLGSEIIANGNLSAPIKINAGLYALNYRGNNNWTDYEFTYDNKGNAVTFTAISRTTPDRESTTYNLTHGQSNGVFRNVKTQAWYITSQMGVGASMHEYLALGELAYQQLTNNCIKSMEVDGQKVYEYNYTYNSDNFPTRIIRNPNFDGGEYLRYDIEYTKVEN